MITKIIIEKIHCGYILTDVMPDDDDRLYACTSLQECLQHIIKIQGDCN